MRQQMRAFDTYTHINELKKAGFNEEQAAVIIKSLVESRDTDISHLATKEQINVLELKINKFEASTDIRFAKIEGEISSLRHEMKTMILETHASTLRWMVGTMIGIVGIMIAAIKLF